jgi:hypothetical protein
VALPLIANPTEFDHRHIAGAVSSVASNSKTWTSGRLYLAFCGCSGTTLRTVTGVAGASGTWAELPVGDSNYTDGVGWDVSCFTCTNATGTGAITATLSGSASASAFVHTYEITGGFDTSGLVVQSRIDSVLPNASQLEMDTFVTPTSLHNIVCGYFVHRITEALTALHGGTIVGAQTGGVVASSKGLWYKRGDATTNSRPMVSWATNTRGAVAVGLEIKAAKIAAQPTRWGVAA